MLDKSTDKSNWIAYGCSVIGLVAFTFALTREDLLVQFIKGRDRGKVIGRILSVENDTRKRSKNSITWYGTRKADQLFDGDSLFTGQDSNIQVELSGQKFVEVSPNSLIAFRSKGNEIVFDLELGEIASYVTREQSIQVSNQGAVERIKVRPKAAPIVFKRVAANNFKYLRSAESAEIQIGEKPQTLISFDKLFNDTEVEPPRELASELEPIDSPPEPTSTPTPTITPVAPEAPRPAMEIGLAPVPQFESLVHILRFNSDEKIINPPKLNWKAIANAKEYSLEIDAGNKFISPYIYDPLTTSSFTFREVQPGLYFWRIKARGAIGEETKFSKSASLQVLLPRPEILPLDNLRETVRTPREARAETEISLSWRRIPMAKEFLVQVSENQQPVQKLKVRAETISLKINPNQLINIQLAAIDPQGRKISEVAQTSFTYEKKFNIAAPKIQLPANGVTVVSLGAAGSQPILFSWHAVEVAESYELQFALDKEFKNIVSTKTIKSNKFILKQAMPKQKIFWRVRSSAGLIASDWSETRTFVYEK